MDKKIPKKVLYIQITVLIFHLLYRISRFYIGYSELAQDVIGFAIMLGYGLVALQLLRNSK